MSIKKSILVSLNRTIMELKLGQRTNPHLCTISLNRTIMELKWHTEVKGVWHEVS